MELKEADTLALGRFILSTFPEDEIERLFSEMEKQSIIGWRRKPSFDFILKVICQVMEVDIKRVKGRSRNAPLPLTRQLYIYLSMKIYYPEYMESLKRVKSLRLYAPEGARMKVVSLINRNQTYVNNSVFRISNYTHVDPKLCRDIEYLERVIYNEFKAQSEKE